VVSATYISVNMYVSIDRRDESLRVAPQGRSGGTNSSVAMAPSHLAAIKKGMAFQAFHMALFVVVQCPLIEAADALPTLIGATARIMFLGLPLCGEGGYE
jgi:hypothetical protein